MSVLAMILTAAVVIPGDGREKVSGEMTAPRRLDLRGDWEAIVYRRDGVRRGHAGFSKDRWFIVSWCGWNWSRVMEYEEVIDEGDGHLRTKHCLGIYEQHVDNLRICIADGEHRPMSFRTDDKQLLLILHRVKSSK
jgi:hypothetical protein